MITSNRIADRPPIAVKSLEPGLTSFIKGGSMGGYFQAMILGPLISIMGNKKMGSALGSPNQKDLVFLKELFEGGKVIPVIDRCYPLRETAKAIQYLEEGHAQGKVIITVEHDNKN